jgi:large subunit ribosomal protein L15
MALQPCRAALLSSGRRAPARALAAPGLRAYATGNSSNTTTSSNSVSTTTTTNDVSKKAAEDAFLKQFEEARGDNYTTELRVMRKPQQQQPTPGAPRQRWKETPAGMQAGFRMDWAKKPQNKVWAINSNPKRLDEMYERLLGPGGSKMLPEELKWLAVTHKSFDQGRRGFNDKLALMGRLTLVMETTKHIIGKPPRGSQGASISGGSRLAVDNLNEETAKDVVGKDQLSRLAASVGLLDVLRWKPRLTQALDSSGVDTVMPAAIMAIIGAITLQHGSQVASEIVQKRILDRLQTMRQ